MTSTARYEAPPVTLGWRLRIALEYAGLKAEEMAERLHVHRGTITRWTHDAGSPPRAIYLERWADLTGVPLDWLVGGDNSSEARRDTHGYADAVAA